MRAISWLHISDVHMRPQDKWAQDIVMRAMCNDIDAERKNGVVDFILVQGHRHSTRISRFATLIMLLKSVPFFLKRTTIAKIRLFL